MINSELLKEAIADAKAVRATALANAKAALEEAFVPHFEAMFAEKLKEESQEEEQEEAVAEVSAPNQVHGAGGEAKGPATKDVSKGQPQKRTDGGTQMEPVKAGKGPADVKNPTKKVTEAEEEQEESVNEAGLTSEDLDEIIHELEAEVAADDEGEKAVEPALAPEMPAPEGEPAPEVPAEEPEGEVEPEAEPVGEPDGDEALPAEEPAPEVPGEEPAPEVPAAPAAPVGDDEEINLDELLAALNEEADEDDDEKEEKMDEAKDGMPKNVAGQDADLKKVAAKCPNTKGDIGSGPVGGLTKENAELKKALKEYEETLTFVKGQLNEVNLLNAKLLYTNKLFKEFAGVLNDPYRMKIIEAFDLTKSVREVKLAYALLAESLNFGAKVAAKPAPAKKQTAAVKQITEGLASKPVASTKPSKEILSEGANEMATRFKKLAGITTPKQ